VATLVRRLIHEVKQEEALRASIPELTSIKDKTSLAVRQQYEENPYPRWVRASPVGQTTTIEAHLRQKLPWVGNISAAERLSILIAGCGTGQHSIETARRFKSAQVLAIDLSLASLAYAERKTRELGLKNIEYAQADILQLQMINRTFDVIEASGVLHHLSDPMAGWRVLLAMLRPGGFMRVGLYSKLARKDLATARDFIAQRGYGSTASEIRRCRQELANARGRLTAKVCEWADFFSMSSCRDLLFHVQEHRMTLLEIHSFLRSSESEFLGFDLPEGILHSFRQRFADDADFTDLRQWHVFETESPSIFANMYQFWIRKPVQAQTGRAQDASSQAI
jgi:2-polyprenyl-3-methyl-5-hydroxy-6-metoxy-1,4-benzoquinol methylase